MNPARAILNCVQEHLHDRRTSPSHFEFGEILQRDRIAARPVLANGHGIPLAERVEPLLVMQVNEKQLDAIPIASAAFSNIRTGFNGAWRMFHPGRLCGFMTDSPNINGLAWRVQLGEEAYGIAVTAGTLIGTIASAYRLLCLPAVEPDVAVGGRINASSDWLGIPEFWIPGSKQRRDLGVRYASYGLYAVFLHELAHVLRGHLNYFVQDQPRLLVVETSYENVEAATQLARAEALDAQLRGSRTCPLRYIKLLSTQTQAEASTCRQASPPFIWQTAHAS